MRPLACLVALLAALAPIPAAPRPVTDLAGRVVEIPDTVGRVACLEVLCYPRMLMMGAEGRVTTMVRAAAPWMARTNPRVGEIPMITASPGLEDVLATRPQVAFVNRSYGLTLAALTAAGLPALVAQPVAPRAETADAFIGEAKAMVRLFGEVLGGEARARAESWCAYVDERVALVRERLKAVPAERRPRLYYVRGPKALDTQGRGSYTTWIGEIAGAQMVVNRSGVAGKGQTSMEDLIRWNPEVIVVGRQYPPSLVLDDPRWRDIAAVKSGRVHPAPDGVFYWDGGPEQILLLQFLAKLLHPDLFADLDLAAEVKSYYARFYRTDLSDAEVAHLLAGRGPDGRRLNPLNN